MGGRLLDWLGSGLAADLPDPVVDMPTKVVPGSTAFYFSTDTQHLFVYDESGPAWFDIDMAAVTAVSTESLQDMIGAFIIQGAGITVTYDDVSNALVIDCTITQYTNEMAQDTIAALIAAGTHAGVAIVYDDATNTLSFSIQEASSAEVWGGTAQDKVITPKKLKDWRTPVALVDGATITMDGATGVNFYVTLGGNRAFANPTNFNPGQFGVIHVTQDGTGSRTATFGSNFKFAGVSYGSNVLSTTAAAVDAIHYYVRADGTITCFIIKGLTGTPAQLKLDNLANIDVSTPATDGQVLTYDNASSKWKPATPSGGGGADSIYPFDVPDNSVFSWVNQGGATLTVNANGSLSLLAPAASGTVARLRVKTLLAATPYKLTIGIIGSARRLVSNQSVGLVLRDSVSGKLKLFYIFTDNTGQALVGYNWTDANTPSAAMTPNISIFPSSAPIFLQAEDNGTNVILRYSHDGFSFIDFFSVSRTSFMTANQCGFFAWEGTNAGPLISTLFHWSEI